MLFARLAFVLLLGALSSVLAATATGSQPASDAPATNGRLVKMKRQELSFTSSATSNPSTVSVIPATPSAVVPVPASSGASSPFNRR
ncbi:hypothetical protein JCM8097_002280 [Rhodosporidiobolus ruineniae]